MKTDNNITATPSAVLITDTYNTGRAYPRKWDLPEISREAIKRSVRIMHLKYAKYCFTCLLALLLFAPVYAQLNVNYARNIYTGADRLDELLPKLKNRRVAVCANQTSVLRNGTHLVDTLLKCGIGVEKIFTPEHGLRGKADAGERVASGTDAQTGLPVVSLYGKNKKPSAQSLAGLDVLVFDLQDVGARFYTYISTLHYVMEACAGQNIQVLVLDRPNPNGFYVDGPVLDTVLHSFIGMHPIPIVHGMTMAEYAQMINGEKWLKNGVQCPLDFITCKGYTHASKYEITVSPSPNLTTMQAIYYYPTTCLFEGTAMSVGRGTDQPFRNIGMPGFKNGRHTFTPGPRAGAKDPVLNGKNCIGFFITDSMVNTLLAMPQINIDLLLYAYQNAPDKKIFFPEKGSFNILAGTKELKTQIQKGMSAKAIRDSWQPGLTAFKATRKKYLLYADE